MTDLQGSTLMEIVDEEPWLFLDEIAKELHVRCGVKFHGKHCYEEIVRRGLSLKASTGISLVAARVPLPLIA